MMTFENIIRQFIEHIGNRQFSEIMKAQEPEFYKSAIDDGLSDIGIPSEYPKPDTDDIYIRFKFNEVEAAETLKLVLESKPTPITYYLNHPEQIDNEFIIDALISSIESAEVVSGVNAEDLSDTLPTLEQLASLIKENTDGNEIRRMVEENDSSAIFDVAFKERDQDYPGYPLEQLDWQWILILDDVDYNALADIHLDEAMRYGSARGYAEKMAGVLVFQQKLWRVEVAINPPDAEYMEE